MAKVQDITQASSLKTVETMVATCKTALRAFSFSKLECFCFAGFEASNRHLSASQLHLLLHPTEEGEDESLRNSDKIVRF